MSLILYVGNHNYSSWSMRAGVLLRAFVPDFTETLLHFDGFGPESHFKKSAGALSPTATVPILIDANEKNADGTPLVIWDTLAIAEYIAEYADGPVWPQNPALRAQMRSLCAEMHAGFHALRSHCPMNIGPDLSQTGKIIWRDRADVRANVERLIAAWLAALSQSHGPFLGGDFGAVDAYFAPVVMRLDTYGLPVPTEIRAYMDRVIDHPAVADWIKTAHETAIFIDFEEPYRIEN